MTSALRAARKSEEAIPCARRPAHRIPDCEKTQVLPERSFGTVLREIVEQLLNGRDPDGPVSRIQY